MNLASILLLAPYLIGHLAFWCAIFNQIHATSCPKSARRGSEVLILINVLVLWISGIYLAFIHPSALWVSTLAEGIQWIAGQGVQPKAWYNIWVAWFSGYWFLCQFTAIGMTARWLLRQVQDRRPAFWTHHSVKRYDLDDGSPHLINGLPTQAAYRLVPGNQLLKLDVEHKTFLLPNLPAAFDGYKIAHLSDLHMTGRIGLRYFQQIVQHTNSLSPDLICITGDLLDKRHCLPWIEKTYANLSATDGTCFILGNHDRRIKDEKGLREQLSQAGMQDLNGKYWSITRSAPTGEDGPKSRLWLAGNEIPWFAGAEKLATTRETGFESGENFYIALSHSPDQMKWAQKMGFNMMLAGHTHGGQVRLPFIGPIIAPSQYGVRFASGVFKIGKMILHVSRGISGADPLRLNCPPELTLITLNKQVGTE